MISYCNTLYPDTQKRLFYITELCVSIDVMKEKTMSILEQNNAYALSLEEAMKIFE